MCQAATSHQTDDPKNLEQLLERLCGADGAGQRVTVESLLEKVGTRSFAPLLLFAGVIMASPISGIPGVPTTMGALILLISLQLLVHKEHFWMPRWLLKRSVARSKIDKSVGLMRRPARFIDRFLRPRLSWLVRGAGTHVIAVICGLIAIFVPFMEVIPFSATTAGFAVTAFALSLIARDGVLALLAFAATAGIVVLVLYYWL